MDIFKNIGWTSYRWELTSMRLMTKEEKKVVDSVSIKPSEYGYAMVFNVCEEDGHSKDVHIPLSSQCHLCPGMYIELDRVVLCTYSREDDNIVRINYLY